MNKTERKIQCERITSKPEYILAELIKNNDIDGIKKYISEDPKNLAYTICVFSHKTQEHPGIMQTLIEYACETGFNAGEHPTLIYCMCLADLKKEIISLLSLPTYIRTKNLREKDIPDILYKKYGDELRDLYLQ